MSLAKRRRRPSNPTEKPGSTARFWLLTQYNGVAMYDDDEEPPEHRRIVDLEWQSKKPKGWKDKAANSWKQWKVVTELIPEEHQSTIETEGNEDSLRVLRTN